MNTIKLTIEGTTSMGVKRTYTRKVLVYAGNVARNLNEMMQTAINDKCVKIKRII